MTTERTDLVYQLGLGTVPSALAAELYEEGFGAKIRVAIPDRAKRLKLYEEVFDFQFSVVCREGDEVVGLLGLNTREGSMTGMVGMRDLFRILGPIKSLRAAFVLALFERKREEGQLLLDGIVVRSDKRGMGIGGALLDEAANLARAGGYARMRLDVIDTNPDARRLYERKGYRPVATQRFEFLRRWLAFGASTEMELIVTPD